jgi:hypothetical protein
MLEMLDILAWDRQKKGGRVKPVNGIPTSHFDNWNFKN